MFDATVSVCLFINVCHLHILIVEGLHGRKNNNDECDNNDISTYSWTDYISRIEAGMRDLY